MESLNQLIKKIIDLREKKHIQLTLLAVCPNSEAVLEAAVKTAADNHTPMLFAATLNQVDRDGGYTGWTAEMFVAKMKEFAQKYHCVTPLYPCLDHGGPWLKDAHTLNHLTAEETMAEVKQSLAADLAAGYQLLHVDCTVDRTLAPGEVLSIEKVKERTLELISYAEAERARLGLPPVAYEVGSEEVHGGLVDFSRFNEFLEGLRADLIQRGLGHVWPCFIVAQVGTDLHTTLFDPEAARRLYPTVSAMGSLVKGHYTDWVENPSEYPVTGMGGANVGPEFTAEEYLALEALEAKERALCRARAGLTPSNFMAALEKAVVDSNRWKKWLLADEKGKDFYALTPARRAWLAQSGARYIWTDANVVAARKVLYHNLEQVMPDPNAYVIERIARAMDKYINAFNLFDAQTLL